MNRIITIVAASALISAGLVGGLAAANGSRADATTEVSTAWKEPPAKAIGCLNGCTAAPQPRKLRVIPIDGRSWSASEGAVERVVATKTAAR